MLQKFRIWIKLILIDFKRYLKDHFQDGIPFRLKILLWLTGILCLALLFQLFNLQIKMVIIFRLKLVEHLIQLNLIMYLEDLFMTLMGKF